MHRRTYLRCLSGLSLTAAISRPLRALEPLAKDLRNGLGLQLWTIRNQLEADMPKALQAVAEAGYKQIELMSVVDSEAQVKTAKDLGLEVRSAFFNWQTVAQPSANAPSVEQVIEKAKAFGLEYLVFGYIGKAARDTSDKMKKIADAANAAAETISAAGMKLSYHNHSFEFETLDNGQTGFDILMDRFDSELVNFELDVFWSAIGGFPPVALMDRLGNRLGQIHLKDLKRGTPTIYDEGKVPHEAFEEVGDGKLDMQAIMKTAIKHGVKQFHVEQDQSPDPIASIAQSAEFVAKNLW